MLIYIPDPQTPSLTCSEIEDTTTKLLIEKPDGFVDKYSIHCPQCPEPRAEKDRTDNYTYHQFRNLKRGQEYTYSVMSVRITSSGRSTKSTVEEIRCKTTNVRK